MSSPVVQWIKQTKVMNTTGDDQNPTIASDSSGNIYVSYYTTGTVSSGTFRGTNDIVVFKLDTNGNMAWIKQTAFMNTTGDDKVPSIAIDSSGNVYVSYYTRGTVSGGILSGTNDIVVFKLDTNGNMVWIKQTALMNTTGNDQSPTISVDTSGNVYVSYYTTGTVSSGTFRGTNDIVVFKLDTNGNMAWIKQTAFMNTTGDDKVPSIAIDSSGNVYVSYYTRGTVSGGTLTGTIDIVVFKLDTTGNMVWIKETALMNTNAIDQNPTIAVDSSGNVYVSYETYATVSGGNLTGAVDIVVFKLDTNGNMVWIKQTAVMNTTGDDKVPSIAIDSSGNVYVSYYSSGTVSGGTFLGGSYDIVVFKMDTNGNMVWIKQEGIMNTTEPDYNPKMAVDSSGNVYVSYYSEIGTVSGGTFTGGGYDIVVFKLQSPPTSTPPAAPTALYSLTGDQQLTIAFTPGSNGGSPITNYQYSIDNGSNYTAFSPATGAVSSVTITALTNAQSYNIKLKAVNANGAGTASATVTGTPASATNAVDAGPIAITAFVSSQPTTNDAQKANTTINTRAALKAGTYEDDAAKAASQLAYIDAMRTQIGASSYTMPSTDFTTFLNTFTSSASGLTPKPVEVFYPTFVTQTTTIDVSATTSASYFHAEVPVGYSVILQNGAATLKLTNNGTAYVDDSLNVYNVNTVIVLGDKTYTILGIGSVMLDEQSDDSVVCLNEGTHILTPNGNVSIEILRKGDMIVTGTRDVKPIVNIQKIVVVRANENNAPYIIEKEAFGTNCPPNRLIVSPRHAIQLQPGLWEIPREAAKENKRVYQNKEALDRKVIYYHITLPNYESDTLVANGQITEALNDGKVSESYLWNKDKRGYVRQIKPVEKKATA